MTTQLLTNAAPSHPNLIEVNDQDYAITGGSGVLLALKSITASRTVTLPPATTPGQTIHLIDESGSLSTTVYVTVVPSGTDGIEDDVYTVASFPYATATFISDGDGHWVVSQHNNVNLGAGVVVKPSFSNVGLNITIGNGVYNLYSNANGIGRIKPYVIAGANLGEIAFGSTNYVVAKYNNGNPVIALTTNVSIINETDVIPIFTIYGDSGSHLHKLDWDQLGLALPNKVHQSIVKTQRFRRQNGLDLSVSGASRVFNVSSGVIWYGAASQSCAAYVSNTDECELYYHSAGVWTKSSMTLVNNTQYDDGTSLKSVTPNRYAVNFVYRVVSADEKHCFVLLGTDDYKIGDALASQPPSSLPPEIMATSVLVGRIIIEQGATTPYQVDSAFAIGFAPSAAIQPQVPSEISKEETGFATPESVGIIYDSTARTISITEGFGAYWRGIPITVLDAAWTSDPHPNTNGPWFLYYNGSTFEWSSSAWTFDKLQIAFVYYGASNKFAIRETHGLMQWQSHKELHETIGTYLNSGGDIAGITLGSTTAAERRPSVSATNVSDEDLPTAIPALADNGPYTLLNLTGTGTSTFTTASADIVPLSGSNPYYNSYSAPSWGQSLVATGDYMTAWLVAVPVTADAGSQAYRYLWVQGQTSGNLTSQQSYQFSSMNLGQLTTLFTEFVVIGKIILRYIGGDWSITSSEKITGNRQSNVTAPAGNYLSSVAVTSPLSGLGTPGSPIAMTAASATDAGYLTTGTQTIAGAKTFSGAFAAPSVAASSGNFTVAAGYGLVWAGDANRIMTPEDNVQGALIKTPGGFKIVLGSAVDALVMSGTGAATFASTITTTDTTDSTSSTSAASIKTTGGISVAKAGYFGTNLVAGTGFGCNGKSAQTSYPVNAAATDLASVIALCNQLRAAAIANGTCV